MVHTRKKILFSSARLQLVVEICVRVVVCKKHSESHGVENADQHLSRSRAASHAPGKMQYKKEVSMVSGFDAGRWYLHTTTSDRRVEAAVDRVRYSETEAELWSLERALFCMKIIDYVGASLVPLSSCE